MNPRSISFQLSAWYVCLLTSGFLLFGVILWFGLIAISPATDADYGKCPTDIVAFLGKQACNFSSVSRPVPLCGSLPFFCDHILERLVIKA